jgi:beta-lactamase regulating signal transducer with metallopeptidase domain
MTVLDQAFWLALLRALSIETSGVVLMAMVVNWTIQSAFWRRALWQATVICVFLLTVSELSGFGRGLASFTFRPVHEEKQETVLASPMRPDTLRAPVTSAILSPLVDAQVTMIWWPAFLWLGGVLIVLARVAITQICFALLRRRWPKIVNSEINRRLTAILGQLGYRRKVLLLQSPSLASPIAFGILRPAIGLPLDFADQFNPATQDAVLAHELAHLAARDPLWYCVADMASALLWWHPLVWWARRQLHRHCELAADQATAMVPDGPVRLAQCLVSLAGKMSSQNKWELIGVHGGGFRSNLGERVESLLKLEGQARKPLRTWRAGVVKAGGIILLTGLAVCLCGWVEGPSVFEESWHDSAASAFLMAALDTNQANAPVPSLHAPGEMNGNATKVKRAIEFYDKREYVAAEILLTQVLKIEPSNKSAASYLDLARKAWARAQESAATNLYTKVFKVDSSNLIQSLDGVDPEETNNNEKLRVYLTAAGIDLSASSKLVLFNDRSGQILVRATLPDLEIAGQAISQLNASPPQLTIECKFVDLDEATFRRVRFDWIKPQQEFSAILTDDQFRRALAMLNAYVLSAPKVTTLSGRQTHIASETDGVTQQTIDIMPTVSTDGVTVQMVLIPMIMNFDRYDNRSFVGQAKTATGSKSSVPVTMAGPVPHFRVREVPVACNIWDGQTVALLNMMTNPPPEGQTARLTFVTATIIDPAGNRVHDEKDLPFARNTIPPQP